MKESGAFHTTWNALLSLLIRRITLSNIAYQQTKNKSQNGLHVAPVGASLGGIHQGLADRQFRHPIGLAGLVDETDHLLPY